MAQPLFDLSRHTRHKLFDAIVQTLNNMPENLRRVFVLSHYQGNNPQEIAAKLGLKESDIPKLLHDANLRFYRGVNKMRLNPNGPAEGHRRQSGGANPGAAARSA